MGRAAAAEEAERWDCVRTEIEQEGGGGSKILDSFLSIYLSIYLSIRKNNKASASSSS
jgi:hypothetical protein